MTRLVSGLSLIAGAGLLVVWLATPATSAPPQKPQPVATAMDQVLPIVADMNAQVDRLRDRLGAKADYPVPSRDLFRFALPPRPANAAPPSSSTRPPVPVVPDAPPAPHLVAILTDDTTGATTTRSAVLSDPGDDDVHIVTAGDAIGGYVVADIQDDVVVLTDARSGASVRLTLH